MRMYQILTPKTRESIPKDFSFEHVMDHFRVCTR